MRDAGSVKYHTSHEVSVSHDDNRFVAVIPAGDCP